MIDKANISLKIAHTESVKLSALHLLVPVSTKTFAEPPIVVSIAGLSVSGLGRSEVLALTLCLHPGIPNLFVSVESVVKPQNQSGPRLGKHLPSEQSVHRTPCLTSSLSTRFETTSHLCKNFCLANKINHTSDASWCLDLTSLLLWTSVQFVTSQRRVKGRTMPFL